jgi:molybdopterin-containing oxidoreductase family iron-sulfur binding subunit
MSAGTEISRRAALKLFAAGAAVSLAGCSRPYEEILPYVDMPEGMAAGEPEYYATALPLGGYARGVIVKAVEGRPIKIAGNPRHPASLGATDIFGEAEIMALYDPERSGTIRGPNSISGWSEFFAELLARTDKAKSGAAPLHILTSTVTSPTLLRQIAELSGQVPGTRWFAYDPAGGAAEGARLVPRLDKAKVIVSLDADPLGPGPMQVVLGRRFIDGRRSADQRMSRLYAVESIWTLTGANADHRLALPPAGIEAIAMEIAGRLGGGNAPPADLPGEARHFVEAMLADLKAAGQGALLLAGGSLSAAARKAVDDANRKAGAPVDRIEPPQGLPHPEALGDFLASLYGGKVENLLVLDCNPAYDAAPGKTFADRLEAVPFAVHAGCYDDETAGLCRWHLPLSHPLEAWSDLTSADGAVSIVQPLIRPLYETRSAHEVVALYAGQPTPSGHDIVRATWRQDETDEAFENWWRGTLVSGIVSGRAPKSSSLSPAASPAEALAPEDAARTPPKGGFTAVLRPDPTIYDGRFSNNAWLQECPKPLSKGTWTNVVSLAPVDAQALSVEDGDVVAVASVEGAVEGPARIDRGQAKGVVGLTLGYGRLRAGAIGTGLGYNARLLAPGSLGNVVAGVKVIRTGRRAPVPSTQMHFSLEGDLGKLLPEVTAGEALPGAGKPREPVPSLFGPGPAKDPYSWAMVIDTAACIGCNACVIACQSENNIAVVGPDEVANGRAMHWLRIDRYDLGDAAEPRHGFEPVPCMHCEKAPCEPVCPVEASVHDTEGLNVQVYNRCVGTRFCQSNCPYKVRRFNWFAYNSGQEYQDLGKEPMRARFNPDVTVRARGVMEKCTYCVQRISGARREAEKTDTPIPEGGVTTACQDACPTRAIQFGNLQDPASKVNRLRADRRHFTLLAELGTRPRTTYLARVRNPNPKLAGDSA